MPLALDPACEEHLDALHYAIDFIPKRAIRFFLEGERVGSLIREMEDVLADLESYREEESQLLYYGSMILASLRREEGIPLIRKLSRLSSGWVEHFLGERLFDSVSLAIAELHRSRVEDLKTIIEDKAADPSFRAACLQAMMILFGQKVVSRDEIAGYFKSLLENRSEKIPYFYEVLASASFAFHPEEIIEPLRQAFKEGFIDEKEIKLSDIEEILPLTKEEVAQASREMLSADLTDLIAHLDEVRKGSDYPDNGSPPMHRREGWDPGSPPTPRGPHRLCVGRGGTSRREGWDRNDPCPCGSGLKFKKCCI